MIVLSELPYLVECLLRGQEIVPSALSAYPHPPLSG